MSSGNLITRNYSGFRGVDFRGEEINLTRSPDSLNMWKDYKETESIRTRPGMELSVSFDDTVYGVFFYTANGIDMILVHSGTNLYKVVDGEKTELYDGLNTARSDSFIYGNIWYFKDGKHYLQFDGETIKPVEGYIPITSIGCKPEGGGTTKQDVNMLSVWRKNSFAGDGKSTNFYVDSTGISDSFNEKSLGNDNLTMEDILKEIKEYGEYVMINGKNASELGYQVETDYENGCYTITPAPPAPLTDDQDNVVIRFMKKTDDREKIEKCTLLQVFDNRVFFSGNPDCPNTVYHCSLDDPSYCSDLDYYNEGSDTSRVKGLVAGNNALWAFKEPSQANTTVFYHTPTIDSEYGKIYPSSHSSIAIGCVGKAINFNDDIVFFSSRGMEGISGDITTEQVIAHRSSLVDRKLIAEQNYEDMILEEWEGYLVVIIGNKAYLADSRAMFSNENHAEYEWFYWEFDKTITCAKVHKGILYLGTDDGVYTLTDNTSDVESYWVTPKDKFKYPQYMKTTNKRGCVVEAIGNILLYVKTDKTDFELIGNYENITDAFVSRIKRKKFKDIQLKFYSRSRFSLETATLECFIGGYIKR